MPAVVGAQLSFIMILFIDIKKAKLSQDEAKHLPSLGSSVTVWYPCESMVTTHSHYLTESLHSSAPPPQLLVSAGLVLWLIKNIEAMSRDIFNLLWVNLHASIYVHWMDGVAICWRGRAERSRVWASAAQAAGYTCQKRLPLVRASVIFWVDY